MPDDFILYALLVFLYVTDSYFLLHKHSVAFRDDAGGLCRIILPGSNSGSRDRALHLYSLLPPLRPIYLSNLLPVSWSEKGILSYVSQTIASMGRPKQSGKAYRYSEIRSVEAQGNDIRINGEFFAGCRDPRQAALVARSVEKILKSPGHGTGRTLQKSIRPMFDTERISSTIAGYRKKSFPLRILCNAVFIALFFLFPVLSWRQGLGISLLVTLGLLVLLLPPLCVFFSLLHKEFADEGKWDRIGYMVRFVLCPPCAIRANDLVSRSLVGKYHPAAVAVALCRESDATDFLLKILRDLRNPLRQEVSDELSLSIDEDWRMLLAENIGQAAMNAGLEIGNMPRIPEKLDPSIRTFCPRCLSQFYAPIDSCPDCLGMTTVPFPGPGDSDDRR